MLAEGDCEAKTTESAMATATQHATVVKKPKTFCTLVNEVCILKLLVEYWLFAAC